MPRRRNRPRPNPHCHPTNQEIGFMLMAQLDALTTAVAALSDEVALAVERLTAPTTENPTQAEVDAITEKVVSAVSTLQAALAPAEAPAPPAEPTTLG